jgi:osmosensitive K+ channel His kinase sensor protein
LCGEQGQIARRGHLRIYLGSAPGVGKTFAMLGEATRRSERGTDVVVGLVEDPRPSQDPDADRGSRGTHLEWLNDVVETITDQQVGGGPVLRRMHSALSPDRRLTGWALALLLPSLATAAGMLGEVIGLSTDVVLFSWPRCWSRWPADSAPRCWPRYPAG